MAKIEIDVAIFLKELRDNMRKQPINPAYDTGFKARSGIYYAGSLGDAYMKGRNEALSWIDCAIKVAEEKNETGKN